MKYFLKQQRKIPSAMVWLWISLLFCCVLACRQPNPNLLSTELLTAAGSILQTQVGQSFEVVLPSLGANPRYRWVLKESESETLVRLTQEKQALSEYLNRTAPVGYAPNVIFVFETLTAGETELVFAQASLSDPEQYSGIERKFTLKIKSKNTSEPG